MPSREKEVHDPNLDVPSGKFELEAVVSPPVGDAEQQQKGKRKNAKFAARPIMGSLPQRREKVVGLKDGVFSSESSWTARRKEFIEAHSSPSRKGSVAFASTTIEEKEAFARSMEVRNPCALLFLGNLAALKVMCFYLISLETIITCALTVGLTCYWYYYALDNPAWIGGGMDFIILAFAVTSPVSGTKNHFEECNVSVD
jgi:hypothetical protein